VGPNPFSGAAAKLPNSSGAELKKLLVNYLCISLCLINRAQVEKFILSLIIDEKKDHGRKLFCNGDFFSLLERLKIPQTLKK
jgi:hypothetical protein